MVRPGLAACLQQERGMKLFEIFKKEARQKRKAKLKEEMQRGYFDDFREFRDSKGKVFAASGKLLASSHAPTFPHMQVVLSDGSSCTFPPAAAELSHRAGSNTQQPMQLGAATQPPSDVGTNSAAAAGGVLQPSAASLVCLAFRAGAQPMIEAWATAFGHHFQGRGSEVALYEMAIVEGVVMRMWPFKQLLLRGGANSAAKYAFPCRHLHHFGDMQALRSSLHLTNLLTGYVFLIDSRGRLRWRGSGSPTKEELDTLLRCTEQLLQEEQAQQLRLAATAA
ncbi:hypothetical protein D9Q98_002233 [Chlorella vulgaris]|uniref:Uncharacterized protein n=1 Tax=Chlorella vulgaris TaxID=3077 RepID=A0A9D4TW13_CHLVU|nr:hypothetical protein D9Q98_002233 [Chlorella vulgaris]